MKEILLFGDSICRNYHDAVISELGEGFNVSYIDDNARYTAYTLNQLRFWLPSVPKPDVVHWNNGIWDLDMYYGEGRPFTPLDEYLRNLERIVSAIRYHYGADQKIIFALTTPQRDSAANALYEQYNAEAEKLLTDLDVEIDDLYSVIKHDISSYLDEDGRHLSERGIKAAGKAVADVIRMTAV